MWRQPIYIKSMVKITLAVALLMAGQSVIWACERNMITIYQIRSSPELNGAPAVTIELTSLRPFPAINAAPTLHIGHAVFYRNSYKSGNLNTLIFTLMLSEFAQLAEGDPITIQYDPDSQGQWDFGLLNKGSLIKNCLMCGPVGWKNPNNRVEQTVQLSDPRLKSLRFEQKGK